MLAITEKIEEVVTPVLEDLGLELVDLEYKCEQHGWVLRFYLDKEGGITLDDCADASREISSLLDVEDVIQTAYNLEVSSPGIERPLKKLKDFERFIGQQVKIKSHDLITLPGAGKPVKTLAGTLTGVDGETILVTLSDRESTEVGIELSQIEKANLKFEF